MQLWVGNSVAKSSSQDGSSKSSHPPVEPLSVPEKVSDPEAGPVEELVVEELVVEELVVEELVVEVLVVGELVVGELVVGELVLPSPEDRPVSPTALVSSVCSSSPFGFGEQANNNPVTSWHFRMIASLNQPRSHI